MIGNSLAGIGTIAWMFNNQAKAGAAFDSYMRNRVKGDSPAADLDAIEIAILAVEATGNYFYGYAALDVLLQ